jgi:DNA-binding NarL/FixJ family response regulator
MVRIVVYSDQPILAKGLESMIAADPELELTAYCPDLAALKERLANLNADLAVLDLTPEITSAALDELHKVAPECKLILWTNSMGVDFALQALTIGIRGVLSKTSTLEAHRQCLHGVYSGQLWFEKNLTDSFRAARCVSLTPRESQLVATLSRGLKNKEISSELGITEGTVKVYLSQLFHKSGAKDRLGLALLGLKNLSMAGTSMPSQGGLRSLMVDPVCQP